MQPSNNLRRYNNQSGCQLPPTARSEAVRILEARSPQSKDRTLRITIRIETRKCDRNTELMGDRPTGNFEVLGIEYCDRQLTIDCAEKTMN